MKWALIVRPTDCLHRDRQMAAGTAVLRWGVRMQFGLPDVLWNCGERGGGALR